MDSGFGEGWTVLYAPGRGCTKRLSRLDETGRDIECFQASLASLDEGAPMGGRDI